MTFSEEPADSHPVSARGFLSYAHEDTAVAERLHRALTDRGCSIWFDRTNWDAGQSVDEQVLNAIRESNYFVLLLTPTSVSKNGYVRKEIAQALKIRRTFNLGGAYIVPVRSSECLPLATELDGRTQFIDLFAGWDQGVDAIVAATPTPADLEVMLDSPFAAHLALCRSSYLEDIAQRTRNRFSIAVAVENTLSRLAGVDPSVLSRKAGNTRTYLADLSACLELHFTGGCGSRDAETKCHNCGATGAIIHGTIDQGGKSASDYNDNYIVWCTACCWADYSFEVDYLGSGPKKFNYSKNLYE